MRIIKIKPKRIREVRGRSIEEMSQMKTILTQSILTMVKQAWLNLTKNGSRTLASRSNRLAVCRS